MLSATAVALVMAGPQASMADPEPTDPGTSETAPPDTTPPDTGTPTDPGTGTDVPTTDPTPSDPGPSDPGPSDPGPSDPGPTDPGPTDPGPTDPTSPGSSTPGSSTPGTPSSSLPGSSSALPPTSTGGPTGDPSASGGVPQTWIEALTLGGVGGALTENGPGGDASASNTSDWDWLWSKGAAATAPMPGAPGDPGVNAAGEPEAAADGAASGESADGPKLAYTNAAYITPELVQLGIALLGAGAVLSVAAIRPRRQD